MYEPDVECPRSTSCSKKRNGAVIAAHWAVLLVCMTIANGCKSKSVADYVPAENVARQALQTALDAWQQQQRSDELLQINDGPRIQVLDIDWRAGKKLSSFQILGELPAQPTEPKRFSVKLTYEGQPTQETTYHVVGIDPLLVFREEDYQKTTGM